MAQNLDLAPKNIIGNIVASDKEVWAYYRIGERPYEMLSPEQRHSQSYRIMTAFGNLAQMASAKSIDCHILTTTAPFSTNGWMVDLYKRFLRQDPTPNEGTQKRFASLLSTQAAYMKDRYFRNRFTYLGVKLGTRKALENYISNPLEVGIGQVYRDIKTGILDLLFNHEVDMSDKEVRQYQTTEQSVFRRISIGELKCKRLTSEELLLLIKRRLYPNMPVPYLMTDYDYRIGQNDIIHETGGIVHETGKLVQVTQMCSSKDLNLPLTEIAGCRATLTITKLPNQLNENFTPFLNFFQDCTTSCRFSLIQTHEMKKELEKQQNNTKDELNNLAKSDIQVSEGIRTSIRDQQILEKALSENNLPWIKGTFRITIEAHDEEELISRVEHVRQLYKDSEFVLQWTFGDQLTLLKEEIPGSCLQAKDFLLTTDIGLIGIAGIGYGVEVGDQIPSVSKLTE